LVLNPLFWLHRETAWFSDWHLGVFGGFGVFHGFSFLEIQARFELLPAVVHLLVWELSE